MTTQQKRSPKVEQKEDLKTPKLHFSQGLVSTLSTKLSLALIAIVITLGVAVLIVTQSWMKIYYEELSQKLNSGIATYVTKEYQLMRDDGNQPNPEAIKALANQAMIINPVVEVYLLAPDGKIMSHDLPPESILHTQVPLGPIKLFLSGQADFPLRGLDPRTESAEKVFSVAEVNHNGELQGYLYVVLGGQMFDSLEDGLGSSYSRSMMMFVVVLVTIAAVITGTLVFNLLVRRLSRLSYRMEAFGRQHLEGAETQEVRRARDEVDLLSNTYDQMAAKIAQQFQLLRESDEVRRELISNVSHDLRTPLATIQGYLETLLIKNAQLNEAERLEYLNTAMKSSRRLAQLIGDLFELSKLDSNHTTPNFEQFSLAELAYDTVQEFKLEFEEKQIQIEVLNNQQNATVYADISLIQRVFENLIRNAIAYTPENGTITIGLDASAVAHNSLDITISDTGRGIAAEDIPHIFNRFYANPDRSRKDVISTGLGLAIVKKILELHNSDIDVKSQLNQGTRFEFSLPVAA